METRSVLVLALMAWSSGSVVAQDAPAAAAAPPKSTPTPPTPATPPTTPAAKVAVLEGAEAFATRKALQVLLGSMAERALDADVDGFLRLVDPADDRFVNEQKYWAKDLLRVPAASLSYELGEELRSPAAGVVETRLTVKWAMKKPDGSTAKGREVSYDARFTKRGGVWTYSGEAWERYESPAAVVMYWPGWEDLAKGVAQVFPEIRDRVQVGFMLTFPRAQQVKLYSSMRHLQYSICLSYTDGLGGWNEPGEPIKQLTHKGQTGEGSRTVLAHEFGHACTFELGPETSWMPWWVLEGVAELSAEDFAKNSRENNDKAVRRMASKNEIPPWKDLTYFNDVSGANYGKVYTLGHHMLGYVSERFGREKRVAWLTAMAKGASLDEATRGAFGEGFDQLDREWKDEIARPGAEEKPAETADPKNQ